jgi:hypothetical protein
MENGGSESLHSQPLELSVVLPCLNEANTVARCVTKALAYMDEHGVVGEVVVADNGSTDGSRELAHSAGARVVDVAEKGYGAALLGGIEAARGRYVIMGDADDSYDLTALGPFVERLREGYELVMGNRFRGGIEPGAMPFLHRYLGNPVLSFLGRLFFSSAIRDFHCGLRGFHRERILSLDLRTRGMEFASEIIVKSTLRRLRITEVPTTLHPDGRGRPPHLQTWRDGWRHLRFLLLYSPRWLFFYPGLSLTLGGVLLGGRLLLGPLPLGPAVLDIQSLMYAGMIVLIGFQVLLFGIMTRVFAMTEGLLPIGPRWEHLLKRITLENGLLAGGAMVLTGVGLSVYAVFLWYLTGFTALNPHVTVRWVVPATVSLALGVQLVFSSFFLSVLGLRRK